MPRQYTRKVRPIIHVIGPSIAYVQLSQAMFSVIEIEDAEIVGMHNWYASLNASSGHYYVMRKSWRASGVSAWSVFLHRQICPSDEFTDHKNRNTMDNRRHNLRPASNAENQMNTEKWATNTSGFKCIDKGQSGRWRVRVKAFGKRKHVGEFASLEEAVRARDAAIQDLHGSFGRLSS